MTIFKKKHNLKTWLAFIIISTIFILITARDLTGDFYWDEAVYADISSHLLRSDFYSPTQPVFTRHPPLYMMLLNILSFIPIKHEITFRFFSIILSCIGLFFILKVFIASNKERIGICALLLLVFNTIFQQYSQSATMYALLFLSHSILFYGYSTRKKYLEIVGTLIGLYTHYFMILTCLIVITLEFIHEPKQFIKIYYKKYLIIFIFYIPWLYYLVPGLFFHKGKFKKPLPHINLYNYLMTFGISGLCAVTIWMKKNIKFSCFKSKLEEPIDRFILLSMLTLSVYLVILILSTPFLRYLYFLLPMWTASFFLLFEKASAIITYKFDLPNKSVLIIFPLLVIFTYIPNYNMFGIFPYCYSYHDQHDSIYHQHWKDVGILLNGNPVAVENIRSYYYYFRQIFPETPRQSHPWENIGIFELKYDPYDSQYNMKHLKKVSTPYVALSRLGPGKERIINQLKMMGYSTYKTIKTTIILKRGERT